MNLRILGNNKDDCFLNLWWVLVLGGLIGALIAFFTAQFAFQTVYLADSRISVSINFKEVGHLSQYEQDQMIGNIVSLFHSKEVIDQTILKLNHPQVDYNNFPEFCTIERQANELLFHCGATDPDLAKSLSTTWAEVSYQHLSQAYNHALEYGNLSRIQQAYETCIQKAIFEPPSPGKCTGILSTSNPASLDELIESEKIKSKNIFSGFKFSEVIPATTTNPVRYQTGAMVISGALMGLILSLLFLIKISNGKK